MFDTEKLVGAYVRLRNHKAELKKKHQEELDPLDAKMAQIEQKLLATMHETGTTSLKAKTGTAYQQEWLSATVGDWSQVLDFIVDNKQYDLLERRVNKTVVKDLLEDGSEVPGVNIERGVRVNIRKAS